MFGRKKPVETSAAILPAAPPPRTPQLVAAAASSAPVLELKPAEPKLVEPKLVEPMPVQAMPVQAMQVQAAAAEPVAVLEAAARPASDDLPPLPLHLQRFGRPSLPVTPATITPAAAHPAAANFTGANQGQPTMSETSGSSPTFRPEIAKRPAMDLGQRPASPAMPAMPSAAPPAAAPAASRGDNPEPKVLIIGREISLTGQITACDRVVVEGKVEATLTDSRFIEIAETGQFKGSAEIEEAEIRGRFEGKLSVRGRLLIRGSGKVMGEIAYGQIEVECGGELSGTVQTVASGRLATSAAAE